METILPLTLLVAAVYLILHVRGRFDTHEPFYQETRDGSLHPVPASEESI